MKRGQKFKPQHIVIQSIFDKIQTEEEVKAKVATTSPIMPSATSTSTETVTASSSTSSMFQDDEDESLFAPAREENEPQAKKQKLMPPPIIPLEIPFETSASLYEVTTDGSFVYDNLRISSDGIRHIPLTLDYNSQGNGLSQQMKMIEDQEEERSTVVVQTIEDNHIMEDEDQKTPPNNRNNASKKRKRIKLESPKQHVSFEDLEIIKGTIGRGASASVQICVNKKTGKWYAKKEIEIGEQIKPKVVLMEIKSLYQCEHDNVIQFFDGYFRQGRVHLLLEYMDKGSLDDVLKKVKKIPEHVLKLIAVQILNGLKYLHEERRIVHRDIKPGNVLINSSGKVKISDFGLIGYKSKQTNTISKNTKSFDSDREENESEFLSCQGTFLYFSPERFTGNSYSYDSDIWSFGVMMFELATGQFPFTHSNNFFDVLEEITRIQKQGIQYPDTLSEPLRAFLHCCLQVNPKQRADIAQLLDHEFLQDDPLSLTTEEDSMLEDFLKQNVH